MLAPPAPFTVNLGARPHGLAGGAVQGSFAAPRPPWAPTTRNCPVTAELDAICRDAAQAVGGGVLAVDLLEDADRLLVSEVNATMEFRNSIDVTGVDIPGRMADFVFAAGRGARVAVEA